MNREDFKILETGVIHFDNGATTFKPQQVITKMNEYYNNYTSNAHRGDYDNSIKTDNEFETTREKVKTLINAKDKSEIVFTSGTTESLNMIVFGFMNNYLKPGDEVILSKVEHASNLLPWMVLQKTVPFNIVYAPFTKDLEINYEQLSKVITPKTKVISLAHITNTIGDERNLSYLGKLSSDNHIILVVDAAQSISHKKLDVIKDNISFLAFSAHKMYGPTGTGILYGKKELLKKMLPMKYGGGMNQRFDSKGNYDLKELPYCLEAGTQNIAGVIGLKESINYLNNISLSTIDNYLKELKEYAINKLKTINNIELYNSEVESNIILFNLKGIFSQDTAVFLNKYHINIRSGNHCAKCLKDELNIDNTCRISFALYNTKEEIDKLIDALNNSRTIFDDLI